MRSKCVNVAEMLDFQGIEGIRGLSEEPRKVSQWYKVVSLSGRHLTCNEW